MLKKYNEAVQLGDNYEDYLYYINDGKNIQTFWLSLTEAAKDELEKTSREFYQYQIDRINILGLLSLTETNTNDYKYLIPGKIMRIEDNRLIRDLLPRIVFKKESVIKFNKS